MQNAVITLLQMTSDQWWAETKGKGYYAIVYKILLNGTLDSVDPFVFVAPVVFLSGGFLGATCR